MSTRRFLQALACAACIAVAPAFAATDDGAQQPADSTHDANSLDENGAFSLGPAHRPRSGETVDPADLSSSPDPDLTPRHAAPDEQVQS